jgi:hypothetical protein
MTEFRNPTWLIERAWSSHSLAALHRVIDLTIADLERIEPVPVGRHGDFVLDARAEALKGCCAELRHACAMAEAEAQRATHCDLVARHISEHQDGWGEAFAQSLEEYRRAASVALQVSLAAHSSASGTASQH